MEWKRLYEDSSDQISPDKILDLLIHLSKIGALRFKDVNYEDDGGDIILKTVWGKVKCDFSEEEQGDYTGDGWSDAFCTFIADTDNEEYVYYVRASASGKGSSDDFQVEEYNDILNIWKDPIKRKQ